MYDWNYDNYLKQLEELVNIDSGSFCAEGIARVNEFLANAFQTIGMITESEKDGLLLSVKSHDTEEFDVMLVGHMDTVFPEGTVAVRPYTSNGKFAYGPGVCDMKAGLIMVLYIVKRLRIERPDLKIVCAFTGDEEIGSFKSKAWMADIAKRSKTAFVFEPCRPGYTFVKKRKGCMEVNIKFIGKASHAGESPEKGINAITEMAQWVNKLTAIQDLENGFSACCSMISGGVANNVIPEHAEAFFDFRYHDTKYMEVVNKTIKELEENPIVPGIKIEYEWKCSLPPMIPNEGTYALIDLAEEAAKDLGQTIGWCETGGFSDSNTISNIGTPVLCGCGPFGGSMHSDEEWLDLETILPRMEQMYEIIKRIK